MLSDVRRSETLTEVNVFIVNIANRQNDMYIFFTGFFSHRMALELFSRSISLHGHYIFSLKYYIQFNN